MGFGPRYSTFGPHQIKIATITAKCSGALSLIGSSMIVWEVLQRPRSKRTTLYTILLGMSLFDICNASMYIVGSWAIPHDTQGNQWQPRGTDATCAAQGAMFQAFGSAVPLHNLSLAMYYFLTIIHGWKEDRLRKWQGAFHASPILFGVITSSYGLAFRQFHEGNMWCWFKGTDQSDLLRFLFFYGPLWTAFGVVICLFAVMYKRVRQQEIAMKRFQFEQKIFQQQQEQQRAARSKSRRVPSSGFRVSATAMMNSAFRSTATNPPTTTASFATTASTNTTATSTSHMASSAPPRRTSTEGASTGVLPPQQPRKRRYPMSRPVFVQGLLFAIVFVLTFLFPTIVRVQQLHKAEHIDFTLLVFMTTFLPLQGLLNWIVFKRFEIGRFFRKHFLCGCCAGIGNRRSSSASTARMQSTGQDASSSTQQQQQQPNPPALQEEMAAPGVAKTNSSSSRSLAVAFEDEHDGRPRLAQLQEEEEEDLSSSVNGGGTTSQQRQDHGGDGNERGNNAGMQTTENNDAEEVTAAFSTEEFYP